MIEGDLVFLDVLLRLRQVINGIDTTKRWSKRQCV